MMSPCLRRRALIALGVLVSCRPAESRQPSLVNPEATRLQRDIAYLAHDRLEGRAIGTPGNDSAAAFIARRYAALGLRAIVIDPTLPGCRVASPAPACATFLQRFTAKSAQAAHEGNPDGVPSANVVAVIPGRDRVLRDEYIVVGAHFDHLGRSPTNALDPDAKDAIRNGADDNASGTAAVMELARLLAARPAKRTVLVANFTGEELGLLGSQWFVEHSPVALDRVSVMLNFDMIGRLRNDKLIVYGVATATELPGLLDSANTAPRLAISAVGDGFGPSDHSSFHLKGIPVLHFFTDIHDDYHRASDDIEKINADGVARIVGLAERMVRSVADRPARLSAVRSAAPVATSGSRAGSSTYLGSIPDMSEGGGAGLKLSGVRAGSPADVGGLQAGDVIVEFGGKPVTDLYSYTDALYAYKPGDKVKVVYRRGTERRSSEVTLAKRGQ